jgi:hypothetical protein
MMRFPVPAGWQGWTSIDSATITFYITDFQHVGIRNSQIYCRRLTVAGLWLRGAGSQSCESGFSGSNTTQWSDTAGWTGTDQVQFSSGTTANRTVTLDVTAAIRYYWQNNASKIVFGFDQVSNSDYTEIWSDQHSNSVVTINYSVQSPPVAPIQNLPAAGAASVTQTPTFTWTHSDPQGDPQASAQVRVWDAAGTTQVGATQTVSGTGASLVWPTALPRGVSYMWDVATADAANGYGPFSAKRAFSVKANPTVTIDTTRYMSFVSGVPRLTVKWTVGSGTQYKYRVTAPGYDSGLVTSGATSLLLSTLALTNGTAVAVTVYIETSDPLNASAVQSFTPRWGQTVHRRDLGAAPTSWGTPVVASTVPSGASLVIEYGSSATATAAPSPATWYPSLSSVPKARYVFYRATFIPSATAGPTLDKVTIPSINSTEVADKWAANLGGAYVLNTAGGYDIDTGEYVYGSRSLHCTVPGVGPYVMSSAPIQVRAGRSYILTGLMKSVGNSGAQFRLADSGGATLSNPDGTLIASIISAGPPPVQAIQGDAEWFTPDLRDVNRYATPVWVSPSDQTVYVVVRAGGTAGAQCWWDGIKLEESSVATPWGPSAVGAVIIDAGGVQIDGSEGGILRYRGSANGLRDLVDGGANGLMFGGDANLWSPASKHLQTDSLIDTPRGSILPISSGADLRNLVGNPGFEVRDATSSCNARGWSATNAVSRTDANSVFTHTGQASMSVSAMATQSYLTSAQFPVDGNTEYVGTGWVCGYSSNPGGNTANSALYLRWYDYNGVQIGGDANLSGSVVSGTAQSWQRYNPSFAGVVSPKNAVMAMLFVTFPAQTAGDIILIDDMAVYRAETIRSIVRMDGFMVDNIGANANNVAMGRFNPVYTEAYRANPMYAKTGRVLGAAWRVSAPWTTGTLVLRAIAGGSIVDIGTIAAGGQNGFLVLATPLNFVANNGGGMQYRTDSTFAPVGSIDVAADLILEYNGLY